MFTDTSMTSTRHDRPPASATLAARDARKPSATDFELRDVNKRGHFVRSSACRTTTWFSRFAWP